MKRFYLFLTFALMGLTSLWAVPTGALPGVFTINSNCDMVYFSQGNLQYIGSAATPYWKFAEKQYEFFGTITGQNSDAQNVDRDLFGWGTSGWDNKENDPTSVHYQPYSTCDTNHGTPNNNYQYGPSNANVAGTAYSSESAQSWSKEVSSTHPYENYDWGVYNSSDLGAGWRVLTVQEWTYVMHYRSPANSVNGVSQARYTLAKILTDGSGTDGVTYNIGGLIIFPDNANLTTVEGVEWGNINSSSSWGTQCTTAGWAALEAAGCVFLPAAGWRSGTSVGSVNSYAGYWSSSSAGAENAFYIAVYSTGSSRENMPRKTGFCVRLVQNVPAAEAEELLPKASATNDPTAASNLTYNGSTRYLLTAAASGVTGGTVKYRLGTSGDWKNAYNDASLKATNAGTYTVQWYVEANTGCYLNSDTKAIEVTIARASFTPNPMQTIEAASLLYNGSAQNLVTVSGSLQSGCEIQYSTNGTDWSTTIPQGTDVGDYIVYYKVVNAPNYETSSNTINVTINPCPTVYDNADPTTTLEGLLNNVSPLLVQRTIYRNGEYNTICLPFALDATQLAASPLAGFNNLKTIKGASISGTAPDLSIDIFVEDVTEMEAGKPYLISYPSANENIVNPVFTDITVTTTEPGNVEADGVTFQGMFAQVHIDPYTAERDEDYLFLGANSQLMWPNDDGSSMRGFRAYFIIDRNAIPAQVAPRGTHARFVNAPKQPTSIENTELNTQAQKLLENGQLIILKNGIKYNAQGQVLK